MIQTCPSPCRSQRPGPGADRPGPVGNLSAPPPPAGVEPSSARRHGDKGRILTASGPRQEAQPHRDDPARAVGSRSTGAGGVLDSTAADAAVLGPRNVPADTGGGRSEGPDAGLAARGGSGTRPGLLGKLFRARLCGGHRCGSRTARRHGALRRRRAAPASESRRPPRHGHPAMLGPETAARPLLRRGTMASHGRNALNYWLV